MARLAPSYFEAEAIAEVAPSFGTYTAADCELSRQTAPLYYASERSRKIANNYAQRLSLTLHQERLCREPLDACPLTAFGYKLA